MAYPEGGPIRLRVKDQALLHNWFRSECWNTDNQSITVNEYIKKIFGYIYCCLF